MLPLKCENKLLLKFSGLKKRFIGVSQFYHYHLNSASPYDAESVPISEAQFEARFEENLVEHFDLVFVLTINNARSPIYDNAPAAATSAGVTIAISAMSMTGAVNIGAGGVCIGFVANPHEFGK